MPSGLKMKSLWTGNQWLTLGFTRMSEYKIWPVKILQLSWNKILNKSGVALFWNWCIFKGFHPWTWHMWSNNNRHMQNMFLSVFTFVIYFPHVCSPSSPDSLLCSIVMLLIGVWYCPTYRGSGLDFHCWINESGRNWAHKSSCSEIACAILFGSYTWHLDFLWPPLSSFPSFTLYPH